MRISGWTASGPWAFVAGSSANANGHSDQIQVFRRVADDEPVVSRALRICSRGPGNAELSEKVHPLADQIVATADVGQDRESPTLERLAPFRGRGLVVELPGTVAETADDVADVRVLEFELRNDDAIQFRENRGVDVGPRGRRRRRVRGGVGGERERGKEDEEGDAFHGVVFYHIPGGCRVVRGVTASAAARGAGGGCTRCGRGSPACWRP